MTTRPHAFDEAAILAERFLRGGIGADGFRLQIVAVIKIFSLDDLAELAAAIAAYDTDPRY
jgi:hypothetical protein